MSNDNNINSGNYNPDIIVIPAKHINYLKKQSGLFNTLINKNAMNKEDFNVNGNYLFRIDLLPERIEYTDPKTDKDYVLKRRVVFNGLRAMLEEGRISNPVLSDAITNYFMFSKNLNFVNLTLPASNTVPRANRKIYKQPIERRTTRKLPRWRNNDNYNRRFNNDSYNEWNNDNNDNNEIVKKIQNKFNKLNRKHTQKAELNRLRKLEFENKVSRLENVLSRNNVGNIINLSKRTNVMRIRNNKTKRPSKILNRAMRYDAYAKRRKDAKRNKARKIKTMKRLTNNNEN